MRRTLLLTAISFTIYVRCLFAQAGMLDNSFGTNGKVLTPVYNGAWAYAMAVSPDGKIVIAGTVDTPGPPDWAWGFARYNEDGTPDTAMGTAPIFLDNLGYIAYEQATTVAIQADGKIIIGGFVGNFYALARFNNDSFIDSSFGVAGKLFIDSMSLKALAIQDDGKIIIAGFSLGGLNYDFALERYNSNGILDSSFGVNGKTVTDFGNSDDGISAIAIQPDGKIVAAGTTYHETDYDFALARYNADGTLDTTFNSNGTVSTPIGTSDDIAFSLVLQQDGKVIAAGATYNGSDEDFALARYKTDGNLDTSFNSTGTVTTALGAGDDVAYSVLLQPDSQIVAAGYSYRGPDNDFALARYNTDGTLDSTFGDQGVVRTDFDNGSTEQAYAAAITPKGKIVLAGYSEDDFALAQYISGLNVGIMNLPLLVNSISIYPNPATISIQVHLTNLPSNTTTTLSFINLLGEKVKEQKVNTRDATIDVSDLAEGIYLVKTEKQVVGKFVKE